jgi:energy-coupling factor transporter transmembrane protein EcfT
MKIRIKSAQEELISRLLPRVILLIGLVLVAILFFACTDGLFQIVWGKTISLLTELKQEDFIFWLAIMTLMILIPLICLLTLVEFFRNKKNRTKKFSHLHFTPTGLILENQYFPKKNVFLPYEETSCDLSVSISERQNRHHLPVACITGIKMIFKQKGSNEITVDNFVALPFFYQIADEAKKFRSFSYKTVMENKDSKVQQELSKFSTEQMDNYYHYGLYEKYTPDAHYHLYLAGLFSFVIAGICLWGFLRLQIGKKGLMFTAFYIFPVLFTLPGFYYLSKPLKDFFAAKRLKALKAQKKSDTEK